MRRVILIVMVLSATSGCLNAGGEEGDEMISPPEIEDGTPDMIAWFTASSNGPGGNRFNLATDGEIMALDQPDEPWTIHIHYGKYLQNELTFTPSVEPWNLVATIGPRGPVLAYRSPEYNMFVAEWDGSRWTEGKLTVQPGEIFSFPSLAGSREELVLGFPVTTSLDGARYAVLHLAEGIPNDLSRAERIDFSGISIDMMGDVAVLEDIIAVSYMKNPSAVEVRTSSWQNLSSVTPQAFPGPNSMELSQALYPRVAWYNNSLLVAITEWSVDDVTNDAAGNARPAILYDIINEREFYLQTRNIVEVWPTPQGPSIVWTDAQGAFRVSRLDHDAIVEIASVRCGQFSILPTGTTVSLGRDDDKWTSFLGSFPDNVPGCAAGE